MYGCYVQTIVWHGSDICFPCKYETLEKIEYVIYCTVFNWNDIFQNYDILDRETNDEIRKITLISCISEKWIPFYTKKITTVTRLFPVIFLERNILSVDLSARRVYPLPMFTLRCNFTTYNSGNFVKFWAELFLRINLNSYFQVSYSSEILWISGIADLQHWIL